jgi:quercetin dioxygenase-like cupin family protein
MTNAIAPRFAVTQDGAAINVHHANIGEGLPKHEHVYSHLTICAAGSIVVRKEGIEHVMTKDSRPVNLKANEWHEIEALEDGTVFINVFAEGKY